MVARCLMLVLLIMVSGRSLAIQTHAAAQEAVTAPDLSAVTLTPNDCSFLIQGDDDPRPRLGDLSCGTLDVPENWNEPDGRRIQIGYAVLTSTSEHPAPDPIIYLAGGPGTSSLTRAELWAGVFAGLRQTRDVVFFDQRGTRLSSPLRCEAYSVALALILPPGEEDAAGAGTPEAAPMTAYPAELSDPDELLQMARRVHGAPATACAEEIMATGVDLRQYNSIASANDTIALVKALGYYQFNLFGISYGTRLALEVMRNHPHSGIRSVVLDSVYPLEVKSYEEFPQQLHEAVIHLFADCALDPVCGTAYPDLKTRFIALLTQLRASPLMTAEGVPITDRDLIEVMQGLGHQVQAVPYVPRMIAELEQGEDETYLGIVSGSLFAEVDHAAVAVAASPTTAEQVAATPTSADLGDLSPARRFVREVQRQVAALPEREASQLLQRLMHLDKLAHDRQTLQDFVAGAFPQPDQAQTRDTLLAAVAAMGDADIQEVFTIIEQTITLDDFRTVGLSQPLFYAVECNERIPFQSFANMVTNAQQLEIPDLALGVPEANIKIFPICEVWPSGRAPAIAALPVTSDVPTLILAGAYDVETPVSWSKSAFVTLTKGVFVEFPMAAHGVITFSACAEQVADAFVADPAALPDTSCVAELEPHWALPT